MSVGQSLIANLFNSTYTPSRNPDLYGIKNGVPVDKDGNPTTVYSKPNFLQRVLSPTADQFNDLNAQYSASPIIAQQAESNRMLTPSYANIQNQATAYGATGAPDLIGGSQANTDMATAKTMMSSANAGLARQPLVNATLDADTVNRLTTATNVDPMVIQHTKNQLSSQLGQDPTEAQILDAVNKTKLIGANTQLATAPLEAGTAYNDATIRNITSRRTPPEPFFTDRLTDDGLLLGPSRDPLGQNPQLASYNALQQGLNTQPNTQTTLSTGKVINHTLLPYAESASIPQNIIGNATINGQPDEANQDIIDRHNKASDAIHDSKQAELDSKKADLIAQQKALKAQHLSSGILPNLGRMGDLTPEDITSGGVSSSMLRGTIKGSNKLIGAGANVLGGLGHWLYNND